MIRLSAAYSKKVGLPGYSSHSFSVSIETELQNLDNAHEESARLYDSLQQAVDQQIQNGFVPPERLRHGSGQERYVELLAKTAGADRKDPERKQPRPKRPRPASWRNVQRENSGA